MSQVLYKPPKPKADKKLPAWGVMNRGIWHEKNGDSAVRIRLSGHFSRLEGVRNRKVCMRNSRFEMFPRLLMWASFEVFFNFQRELCKQQLNWLRDWFELAAMKNKLSFDGYARNLNFLML